MRFHEDGARTKALLGKVRQPRAGVRTRSPRPAPRSSRAPRLGRLSLWPRTRAEGLPENYFLLLVSPYSRIPRLLPCEIALSSSSWRNRDGSALGPSSTGSTKLPVILRLLEGRPMIPSRCLFRVQRLVSLCGFPHISDLLGSRGFSSFLPGRLFGKCTVNPTFGAFLCPSSQKGKVARSLGR